MAVIGPITGPFLYDGTIASHIKDRFAQEESPKLKFNFFLKFEFRDEAGAPELSLNARGGDKIDNNYLAVKTASRINPVINYKDVNFYGYRTKVATKTDYSVMNVTLYDDTSNRSLSIVKSYMDYVSPLSNAPNPDVLADYKTIGALNNGKQLGLIKEITIWQVALGGTKYTKYRFYNPKITNIIADELDMTVSDVSLINMSFVYDGYQIEAKDY